MPLDYSHQKKQLAQARQNCLDTIENLESADKKDGAPHRAGSIASIKRDLASYDRQLAEIDAKEAADAPKAMIVIHETIEQAEQASKELSKPQPPK